MDDAQVNCTHSYPALTPHSPAPHSLPQVRPDSIYNRDYNAPTEAEKTLGDVSALPAPMQVTCYCGSCCACDVGAAATREMGKNWANEVDASVERGHNIQEVSAKQSQSRTHTTVVVTPIVQRCRAHVGGERGYSQRATRADG
jgi:hypothetical protein